MIANISKTKLNSNEIYLDLQKLISKFIDVNSIDSSFTKIYPDTQILVNLRFERKQIIEKTPFTAKKISYFFDWGQIIISRTEIVFKINELDKIEYFRCRDPVSADLSRFLPLYQIPLH